MAIICHDLRSSKTLQGLRSSEYQTNTQRRCSLRANVRAHRTGLEAFAMITPRDRILRMCNSEALIFQLIEWGMMISASCSLFTDKCSPRSSTLGSGANPPFLVERTHKILWGLNFNPFYTAHLETLFGQAKMFARRVRSYRIRSLLNGTNPAHVLTKKLIYIRFYYLYSGAINRKHKILNTNTYETI